jgi:hypothetical protein
MTETDPQEQYRDPDEGGCHHFRDPADCDECTREREHSQRIEFRVKMLDEAVGDAKRAVGNAINNLRELVSGEAWYIELAESTDGGDALDDLDAAMRLLRNVWRITREHKRLLKADGR